MKEFYDLQPEDYLKIKLEDLSAQDLKELSYYLWCCLPEEEKLMKWRSDILLPLVEKLCKPCDFEESE